MMTLRSRFMLKHVLMIILAFCQFATLSLATAADQSIFGQKGSNFLEKNQPKFLPVDQAFKLSATQGTESLQIIWNITPEYYLYRHQLKIEEIGNDDELKLNIPGGKAKHDEYFGDVEVYYHSLIVEVQNMASDADSQEQIFRVSYQGCADAGLCYPPQKRYLRVQGSDIQFSKTGPQGGASSSSSATNSSTSPITEEQRFTELLTGASLLTIVGLFLLAGLALTFTPCVLPMVPIISSVVIGREQQGGRRRAFSLSLTYVLAMAITYAAAGTITGYFGAELNLQMKLQSPWVLSVIALLFVAFALAMFDVYELRLPNAIQSKLSDLSQQQSGGTYVSVAVIGMLSSLIVSPCVSAPLAGALVYISSTGDPLLGGLALLALGLGMGIPLLLIGTFGANFLPKAGLWMNHVKVFFGVLLLGVAIWMVERILPAPLILAMFILLFLGYAIYLKTFQAVFKLNFSSPTQFLGVALLGYGLILLAGATQGGFAPFAPIDNFNAGKHQASREIMAQFVTVKNLKELDQQIAQAGNKPVMLDIYADWCVSCQILEHDIFPDPQVADELQKFLLLRADVTKNSPQNEALMKRFSLFGPPGLLFFSSTSGELRPYRIQGEIGASQLGSHLEAVLQQNQNREVATN